MRLIIFGNSTNKSGSSILKRNEHGQGEKNQKLVAKTKDQKAKITVEIQEQSYTQEELQRVFDTAGKKLETLILGENKSLDEVRYDLNLVKQYRIRESRYPGS